MKIAKVNKKLFIFICFIILSCVSISFAYFFSDSLITADDIISFDSDFEGYFALVDKTPLTLEGDLSSPISDAKALESDLFKNEFQVKNATSEDQTIKLYIAPLTGSTLEMTDIKYAVYESGTTKPTSGKNFGTAYAVTSEIEEIMTVAGHNIKNEYYSMLLINVPAKTTKTYNLHMWVSSEVGNSGMDKSISLVLFYKVIEEDTSVDVSTLNYLSTNYGNTIFNLVSKQGVNVTNVDSISFLADTTDVDLNSVGNIALFKGTDNKVIKAWTENTNLYIGSIGGVHPGPSMDFAFYNMQNLNVLDMNNVNISNVTNMYSMFDSTGRNSTVFTLNLGNEFNTSNVTNMSQMFFNTGYSSTVFTLKLGSEFNTSNVTDMSSMFLFTGYSSAIFTLNLGNKFNTSKVKYMHQMFYFTGRNSTVFTLNLGNEFNTANVTNMASMFTNTGYRSTNFTLNLGNQFNTSKVISMADMFSSTGYSSTNFTLNLGNEFNTSKVTNMRSMFSNTGQNSTVFTLNLGNEFNTANVTNMSNMFMSTGENSTVFTLNLGNEFNTAKVTDMRWMFLYTGYRSPVFTLNLGNQFNTSKVTNMSNMFSFTGQNSTVFTLNLGNEFNTSNVTNMANMFLDAGCNSTVFTLNLGSEFNTSNVTNMSYMFYDTGSRSTDFTLNLGNQFNTLKVINMSRMFDSTGRNSIVFTLNLGNQFNTSNVTRMDNMFYNTGRNSTVFTLNLGNGFNTSNVTNMVNMFSYTGYSSSWTLNLKSFDFSNVGTSYRNFFTNRSSSNVLNVLCTPLNCDFINERVGTFTGYNVVGDYTGYTQYTITLDSSVQNVTVSHTAAYNTQKITLSSTTGYPIESFKLNGTLVEDNTFIMPESNVTITDVVFSDDIVVESSHNPYENSLDNVVYYENTFDGATSITVELTYQTESTSYDWVYLYQDASTIYNNQKYGGTTQKTETITIPSNYLKIVFKTDGSGNNYYGFKAVITPNY